MEFFVVDTSHVNFINECGLISSGTAQVSTHVISAILNVGQDVIDDWPLQILDHAGRMHEVVMAAGEMVLYESAKNVHGRLRPFNGNFFDNMFVHFRPKTGWEKFSGVPNGDLVSDHVKKEL